MYCQYIHALLCPYLPTDVCNTLSRSLYAQGTSGSFVLGQLLTLVIFIAVPVALTLLLRTLRAWVYEQKQARVSRSKERVQLTSEETPDPPTQQIADETTQLIAQVELEAQRPMERIAPILMRETASQQHKTLSNKGYQHITAGLDLDEAGDKGGALSQYRTGVKHFREALNLHLPSPNEREKAEPLNIKMRKNLATIEHRILELESSSDVLDTSFKSKLSPPVPRANVSKPGASNGKAITRPGSAGLGKKAANPAAAVRRILRRCVSAPQP
ncbi:uncharacterized protein EV422DRAFT_146380 [Fimicolochytrium jonesii]|uniref:uncharacterized protein n=1 Tax=Fimicolochytrium jonesii TaxID=1396493 RepID=UPI0022FEEA95|nr:uncharacterized protein EV422DRAFT_146380 [Fimicolochytrium jonesii]KAI8825930.1 hypothetical protein EV422DRAFT_146380 [Fimicolochytrium jonesii]